jgi:hypothetical protein
LPRSENFWAAYTRLTRGIEDATDAFKDATSILGATVLETAGELLDAGALEKTDVVVDVTFQNPLYSGPLDVEEAWLPFAVWECENFQEELDEAQLPLVPADDPIRVV